MQQQNVVTKLGGIWTEFLLHFGVQLDSQVVPFRIVQGTVQSNPMVTYCQSTCYSFHTWQWFVEHMLTETTTSNLLPICFQLIHRNAGFKTVFIEGAVSSSLNRQMEKVVTMF